MIDPGDRIKGYLYFDERIIWLERSGGGISLNWKIFIALSTMVSLITVLVAAISETVFSVKLIIFIFGASASLIVGIGLPYYLYFSLRQTFYAITNRRVLTFNHRELKSTELYKINEAKVSLGKGSRGSLLIIIVSPAFTMNGRLRRSLTRLSFFNFRDINEVKNVYRILLEQIAEVPDKTEEIFPRSD